MLAFSFLSLGKGALLTSAHPLFVLREHHCNTSLEALTLCQCEEACPFSKNRPRSEQKTTKRRAARQGRNATAISARIWMILHGLQFLCLLPNDVEMLRNADIPVSQLILLHAFPSYFSVQINYVQLQLCCQVADWWLQFQDFDKWKKKKKSGDLIGLFEVLKLFFIKPFWN